MSSDYFQQKPSLQKRMGFKWLKNLDHDLSKIEIEWVSESTSRSFFRLLCSPNLSFIQLINVSVGPEQVLKLLYDLLLFRRQSVWKDHTTEGGAFLGGGMEPCRHKQFIHQCLVIQYVFIIVLMVLRRSYGTCIRLFQLWPTFTRLGSCTGKIAHALFLSLYFYYTFFNIITILFICFVLLLR